MVDRVKGGKRGRELLWRGTCESHSSVAKPAQAWLSFGSIVVPANCVCELLCVCLCVCLRVRVCKVIKSIQNMRQLPCQGRTKEGKVRRRVIYITTQRHGPKQMPPVATRLRRSFYTLTSSPLWRSRLGTLAKHRWGPRFMTAITK